MPGASCRVIGRYAIFEPIASGGMATVHIGRLLGPVGFARTVAIKCLHPRLASDPDFVRDFLDEARLAAKVQHPNVVQTVDVVCTDKEMLVIMDYVRGESLAGLLKAASKADMVIPPKVVAAIILGALHGLHAVHEAKDDSNRPLQIIHRDISPQNILVGADGVVRVLDFGVAKAAGRAQSTKSGVLKGKLAYMPIEQITSQPVDRRADLYSMGITLWEALTRKRLFTADNEAAMMYRVLNSPIPMLTEVAPDLVPYEAMVAKAVSRDVADRYPTAREMARALDACASVASQTEIGEWVEQLVGPVLEKRASLIAELETFASVGVEFDPTFAAGITPSANDLPEPAPPIPAEMPVAAAEQPPPSVALETKPFQTPPVVPSVPAPPPRRPVVAVALVVGGLLLTLLAAAIVKLRQRPTSDTEVVLATTPPPIAAAPEEAKAAPPIETVPAPTAPATPATPMGEAAPTANATTPHRSPPRAQSGRPTKARGTGSADPNHCMVLDAQGIWHVKQGCL